MIYNVKIVKVELCGCGSEGDMIISLNDILYRVYYQMPDDYIKDSILKKANWLQESERVFKITENSTFNALIDLWLVYGHCKLTSNKIKNKPSDLNICGGICRGDILNISSGNELQIDCGIQIDVDNESEISEEFKIGDYIEVSGTFQIYMPHTDFER